METELQISGTITAIDADQTRDWARIEVTRAITPTTQRTFSVVIALQALTAQLGDEVTAHVRAINHSSQLSHGELQLDLLLVARSLTSHA